MKHLLIALFILSHLVGKSQAKISVTSSYYIYPNDTINYGDSVTLVVNIKNVGNAPYSGQILVQGKRDTILGGNCGSTILTNPSLLPNDSMQAILQFTPSLSGNFKVGGNGNTIVVWPYIISGSGDIGDSLRFILYITDFNSVKEIHRNNIQIYPNPVSDLLNIKGFFKEDFTNITIYDVFARKVKELSYVEQLNLSELNLGSYWMLIQSKDELYRMHFIKN